MPLVDSHYVYKTELADNQEKINALSDEHESDLAEFLEFAFGFLKNMGGQYFNLPVARRNECTQMLFTGKI